MRDHARLSPDRKASHRGRNSNRKPTSRACTRSLHHQRPTKKGVRAGSRQQDRTRAYTRRRVLSTTAHLLLLSPHTRVLAAPAAHQTAPHALISSPGGSALGAQPPHALHPPYETDQHRATPSSGRLSPLYLPPPSSHGVCEEGRALQILHRVIPSSSLLSPLPRPLPACLPRALPAHTIWARVRGGCVQAGACERVAFLALLVARQRRMRNASTHAHACACRWRVRA